MESSSSVPFKKAARASCSGNHVPSCLVDGCTADLSNCRDYHRRHKVCEVHSKTAKVTIRGQEQRFCQQCSRFHSLLEFDERKRSCRKRLDGHNRRRRKPHRDALSVNSGRFLSNPSGTRYLPLSSPQIFSTTAITSSWVGAEKVETDKNSELNFSSRNSFFHGSSSHSYKGEKQFSFLHLQNASSSLPGVSVCQPFPDANPSRSNGGSSQKMFSNGLNQAINTSRALSLLSSQPAESQQIGLSPMVQSGPASSLIPNLQYNDLAMEGAETILSTDGSNNTNLHGHEIFRTGHRGSSASCTDQTLFFTWE